MEAAAVDQPQVGQDGEATEESGEDLVSAEKRDRIRILVVDDDTTTLDSCESILGGAGYRVDVSRKPREAVKRLQSGNYHILLVDQRMPEVDGFEVIEAMREHSPDTLAIMMTGYASTDASLRALQAGAADYIPKPFTATQLLVLLGRTAYRALRMESVNLSSSRDGLLFDREGVRILGASQSMKDAVKRALKVAPTDASVFITGESGTGKELIARCVHLESRRSGKSFVAVNCAALPKELIESEIFGHRKGAFTGAVRDKPGLLETADGGTFFLDELAEMPVELQPKLLRVLQDGALRRVGSEKNDAMVDVRFISATNRDPSEALDEGLLRHDLYYRLRVVPIHLPPLRERPQDIPVLARYFVDYYWRRHRLEGDAPPEIAPATLDTLMSHHWPGNVRELQNVIEQVLVLAEPTDVLTPDCLTVLADGPGEQGSGGDGANLISGMDLRQPYHTAKQDLIARFERQYLSMIVTRAEGNISEAARQAGIDRTTLYRLMEKHDLDKDELTPRSS
jgi:DNA-binding NtrC family response regulator